METKGLLFGLLPRDLQSCDAAEGHITIADSFTPHHTQGSSSAATCLLPLLAAARSEFFLRFFRGIFQP